MPFASSHDIRVLTFLLLKLAGLFILVLYESTNLETIFEGVRRHLKGQKSPVCISLSN